MMRLHGYFSYAYSSRLTLRFTRRRALPCLLLALLLPAAAGATDCIDYGNYLRRVASVELMGEAFDAAVSGEHLFVADGAGLHIFDITDPSLPVLVGEAPPRDARSVAVQGEHAYVACDNSAFHVVNVADPSAPWIEGSCAISDPVWAVEALGNFAYVAADTAGLQIVDVSDPADPRLVDSIDTPGRAFDLVLRDGYAFLADRSGLYVIDLTNPVSAAALPGDRPDPYMTSIALHGDYAYLLDGTFGIFVFDISDPLSPEYVDNVWGGGSGGMAVAGERLYTGAGPGLNVYDLSKPSLPAHLGGVNTSYVPRGLAADGDHVYVAIAVRQLFDVIDVSNPAEPPVIGWTYLSGWSRHVALTDTHAFVACGFTGLYVVDISKPASPVVVNQNPILDDAFDIVLDGHLAYVASDDTGFHVLDITNAADPEVIGALITPGDAVGLTHVGDYVYVADERGLLVIDITVPEDPWIVGEVETPGLAFDVVVAGDHAYIADETLLTVVDVSDPYDPWIVASEETEGEAVALEGEILFTAGRWCELRSWSLADPGAPALTGNLLLPGWCKEIALRDGYAYLANLSGGMQIVDIAQPESMAIVGSADLYAFGMGTSEDYAFVIETGRLSIMHLHCDPTGVDEESPGEEIPIGAGIVLHPNQPNPFNPNTTIRFTLPEAGKVRLSVCDVRGRALRTLLDGELERGGHRIVWDGRDDAGHTLASGLYLARLEQEGEVLARKMLLLK